MTGTGRNKQSSEEELKEVIKEFLYHLDFAYNYRLQMLVFYGEIWCLQNYGRRLSDASFKPYDYGSFSDDVADVLEEMRQEGEIKYNETIKESGPTLKYLNNPDGGKLSSGKKEVIKQIHEETRGMQTDELAHFSKQTWLFQNTSKGEPMDFAKYRNEVVIPPEEKRRIAAQSDTLEEDADDLTSILTN